MMEEIRKIEGKNKPQNAAEALQAYLDHDTDTAVEFLRTNPDQINDFCLDMMDVYQPNDRATPFLALAEIMEKLARG